MALAVETELATRTGERRHDDIEEKKKYPRAFVRSFVRARACADDDDVTREREGNERNGPWAPRRDECVSSSIVIYIDRLRGTQMSDRQIHKKTKPSKGAEVKKNASVVPASLCVYFTSHDSRIVPISR